MSESVQNNMEIHVEDNLEQGQGSGDQASCQEPQHCDMPPLPSELASNLGNPSYWPTLVTELMKRIPQVPPETPSKEDKLANWVARRNSKVYDVDFMFSFKTLFTYKCTWLIVDKRV